MFDVADIIIIFKNTVQKLWDWGGGLFRDSSFVRTCQVLDRNAQTVLKVALDDREGGRTGTSPVGR